MIQASTFYGCTNLRSVAIPDGVTKICRNSFRDCKTLESVTIPESVTTIDEAAFGNCSCLFWVCNHLQR